MDIVSNSSEKIVSNSSEKMKNDSVKRKSEEEEEENLNFEFDNLTARIKLEKQLNSSEKEEEEEKNDIDTRIFNLGRDLNSSEEKKNDIETRKSEDLNCLEKKSSVMEKSHSDEEKEEDLNCLEKKSSVMEKSHSDEEKEEERMKWRIEDDEYVCYVCGLRGNKFLDYSFGCNQQEVAHRYCAIKDAKVINNESLEGKGKGMSNELSEFFQELRDKKISVIDVFARSVEDFIMKKQK